MINLALARYAERVSKARLDSYPEAYSAHYARGRLLGELASSLTDEPARVVFALMMPFAFAVEVTDSVVIFEAHKAPTPDTALIDATRVLYASHLSVDGNGFRTIHWVVPYLIEDGGCRVYDKPYKSPFFVPKINEVLGMLLDQRQAGAIYNFEEACAAVLAL